MFQLFDSDIRNIDMMEAVEGLVKSFACQCDQKMNATVTGYLPVPTDHYVGHQIFLVCPSCKKCKVVHFYPGGNFAMDDFAGLGIPSKINDKVNAAVTKLCQMVWDYQRHPTQSSISVSEIEKAVNGLTKSDYPLLIAELEFQAQGSGDIAKTYFDPASEFISAAQSDAMFASMSGRTVPEGMTDWYDNEVRAACRDPSPPEKVIDRILDWVKTIEKTL